MNTRKPYRKTNFVKKEFTKVNSIVYLVRNNAEIRHYTSLGMIQQMKAVGEIPKDAKVFIKFLNNKYAVIVNGLSVEYKYDNNTFVTALTASFTVFASEATKVINNFISENDISVSSAEIEKVANNIMTYVSENKIKFEQEKENE